MEDVFKRVEDISNRKTGTGRIRGVQIIPQFSFFLWKAQIKAYTFSTSPGVGWVGGGGRIAIYGLYRYVPL